jgi:hypothetical protein
MATNPPGGSGRRPTRSSANDVDYTGNLRSATQNIRELTDVLTKTTNKMADVAEKGASNLLLGLGATITIFAFAVIVATPYLPSFRELDRVEFVAMLVVAMVSLFGGAAIRVYDFKRHMDMAETMQQIQIESLRRTSGALDAQLDAVVAAAQSAPLAAARV